MSGRKRIAVILNRKSATNGDEVRAALQRVFNAAQADAEIVFTEAKEVPDRVRAAIARGVDVVVAGGGDGTINAVAAPLVGTGIALGVLPLGTLNHFSRDLGIPQVLEAAARVVIEGEMVSIDAGEVNGHVFLNNSSIGVYPHLVRFREAQQHKGLHKWPAFALAAIAVFRRFPLLTVEVVADGRNFCGTTPFVFVGNNEYDERGSRACIDKGRIFLVIANVRGRVALISMALAALFHRLKENRDFDISNPAELRIETQREFLNVALDGEVRSLKTPLRYRSLPAALKVIVPRRAVR